MSDLPIGWTEKSLSELTGIGGLMTDGDWIESKDQDPNGEVRLIQLADIGDGIFTNKSSRFLTLDRAKELRCTFLEKDDLLVARMPDPLGRSCLFPDINQSSVTAVDVCVWRSGKGGSNVKWLMYIINSPNVRNQIQALASGTTRQRISGGNLKKLSLPVPPIAEQRRIVAKLDRLLNRSRNARKELEQIPKLCDRYKQAILTAACSGLLTSDWRKNNIESESTAKWIELRLGQILSEPLANGRSVRDAEYQGFPVLRLTCLKNGRIDLNAKKNGAWTREEAFNFLVREGDFLVSRGNGSLSLVGRGGIVPSVLDDIAYPDTLIRVRAKKEIYNIEFLSIIWNSQYIRKQIENAARTTAGIHKINQKSIEEFILPVPSLVEQNEIVKRVEKIFKAIALIEQEYQNAIKLCDRLDQAILAKAFRGELVAQDPNDEPASVLLERIQAERETSSTTQKNKVKSKT
jgi:type I restriction enzyme, S subunit